MKRFTLYTTKYEAILRDFAVKAAAADIIYINKTGREKNGFEVGFAMVQREAFCELLLRLLMDIAESENPVYKHSAKLRKMARDLRYASTFAHELRLLKEFVSNGKELNIEGYVTFRMGEFREKLDLMIYSLVKKIKFSNGDW
ncbi:MAG: putative sporulation protein YtxC [Defluviitaleaceae bacterium]|nr:putative sporulation protein YtxC [Defluviitaleaceae bacterium]